MVKLILLFLIPRFTELNFYSDENEKLLFVDDDINARYLYVPADVMLEVKYRDVVKAFVWLGFVFSYGTVYSEEWK
jgi:hypothetical protein